MMPITDPITVKKPFTPQAQGIRVESFLLMISIAVGNGIPIKIPNGMISSMAKITRAGIGKAIASLNNAGSNKLAISNKKDKAIMEKRSVRSEFDR